MHLLPFCTISYLYGYLIMNNNSSAINMYVCSDERETPKRTIVSVREEKERLYYAPLCNTFKSLLFSPVLQASDSENANE